MGFTCVAFVAGSLSWWTSKFAIESERMNGHAVDLTHQANINLVFGVVTCLGGFVGVSVGSVWAQVWRRSNSRADPLVCGIGLLVCVPFLFLGLNVIHRSLIAAWYVVVPQRRATASAFQILFSHLFGDAASPYLIGAVSDALRSGDMSSHALHFYSLKHALFIPTFVLVVGGFFFLGTAWYIDEDKRRADLLIKGAVKESDAAVPGSDSTAQLINDADEETRGAALNAAVAQA